MRGGIGLIVLAMSLTPALDAVAKELGRTHDPFFICFARYLAAGLVALVIARLLREPVRLARRGLGRQLLRAGLMMGAMSAFIAALARVPLAEAVGGFLIAPMVATVLSVLVLGERIARATVIGGLLSLLGAALILRPGLGLSEGALLALGGGVLLGGYFAAARAAGHAEGLISALATQSLLGAGLVAPAALAGGLPDLDAAFVGAALALGLLSAACHVLTIAAFRLTEASVLAPFMYSNLFAAIGIGVVWFGEVPDAVTLLGLGAILAGGLVTAVPPAPVARALGRLLAPRAALPLAATARLARIADDDRFAT